MSMFTRSFVSPLFAMVAAFCAPSIVHADETYEFSLRGQMREAGQSWAWTGTLTIVLDTAADGLHDSSDILAFDMASTTGPSFHWPDNSFQPFDVLMDVENGMMTSVSGLHYGWPFSEETTDFTGLSVHYYHPLIIKTPETIGDAILVPLAVPEPDSGEMLLLGLGLVAAGGCVLRRPRGLVDARHAWAGPTEAN